MFFDGGLNGLKDLKQWVKGYLWGFMNAFTFVSDLNYFWKWNKIVEVNISLHTGPFSQNVIKKSYSWTDMLTGGADTW